MDLAVVNLCEADCVSDAADAALESPTTAIKISRRMPIFLIIFFTPPYTYSTLAFLL